MKCSLDDIVLSPKGCKMCYFVMMHLLMMMIQGKDLFLKENDLKKTDEFSLFKTYFSNEIGTHIISDDSLIDNNAIPDADIINCFCCLE